MACEGPCLEHCYKNNNLYVYFVLGILFGFIFHITYTKYYDKYNK